MVFGFRPITVWLRAVVSADCEEKERRTSSKPLFLLVAKRNTATMDSFFKQNSSIATAYLNCSIFSTTNTIVNLLPVI